MRGRADTFVFLALLAATPACSLSRSVSSPSATDAVVQLDVQGGSLDGGVARDAQGLDAPVALEDASAQYDAFVTHDAWTRPDAFAPRDAYVRPDAGQALRSCDAIYSGASSYDRCSESSTACTFYADVFFFSCDDACRYFGGSCVSAYQSGSGHCDNGGGATCGSGGHYSMVCTCTRIP